MTLALKAASPRLLSAVMAPLLGKNLAEPSQQRHEAVLTFVLLGWVPIQSFMGMSVTPAY